MHTGVDLSANSGAPIFATADGWVTLTKFDEAKGNFVQIKHSEVYVTQYSHMASFKVMQGEMVKKGQGKHGATINDLYLGVFFSAEKN